MRNNAVTSLVHTGTAQCALWGIGMESCVVLKAGSDETMTWVYGTRLALDR